MAVRRPEETGFPFLWATRGSDNHVLPGASVNCLSGRTEAARGSEVIVVVTVEPSPQASWNAPSSPSAVGVVSRGKPPVRPERPGPASAGLALPTPPFTRDAQRYPSAQTRRVCQPRMR